jgi:hypothetical protein
MTSKPKARQGSSFSVCERSRRRAVAAFCEPAEAPPGATLYDLAQVELELESVLGCKVEVLTKGFLAPDVAENVKPDLTPLP